MKRIQRFKKKTNIAIIIQTHWRCHKAYSYYMCLQKAAIVSQCVWRRRVVRSEFEKLKMAAREKESLQLESTAKVSESIGPLVKVKRIDLIGVDNFVCILPLCLVDLVNSLKTVILDFAWKSLNFRNKQGC